MTGTMASLWLAALALLATHFGVSSTGLRPRLVAALGMRAYLGLYSLVSVAVFAWLIWAYRDAPPGPVLWGGGGSRWVPVLVLAPALLLLAGGLGAPNPTSVGAERLLAGGMAPTGVLRVTRNPVLWGIGLWALAHVAANGDIASIVFFGALAVLALLGTVLVDARARRQKPGFAAFERATSNVPFLAVLDGRQSLATAAREFGPAKLLAAALAYVLLVVLHPVLFGAPALPG